MLYGSIITVSEVELFLKKFNIKLDSIKNDWLKCDIINIENAPNIYSLLLKTIDFLLLDGGEFSTYSEWRKLKNATKIIALDDIREIKNKEIYTELMLDVKYELLDETIEGKGFAVFKLI